MADAKPFSDEDLRGFKEGGFDLTEKFSGELIAEWIHRFLATIAARDKRIEELEKENLTLLKRQIKILNKIDTQAYEIERLRGELKDIKKRTELILKIFPMESVSKGDLFPKIEDINKIARQALARKEES